MPDFAAEPARPGTHAVTVAGHITDGDQGPVLTEYLYVEEIAGGGLAGTTGRDAPARHGQVEDSVAWDRVRRGNRGGAANLGGRSVHRCAPFLELPLCAECRSGEGAQGLDETRRAR
jgi:hypothetical protein